MKNTVIGVGNLLRTDDGIGVHVVKKIRDEMPEVEARDITAIGLEILEYIKGRENVVIIDAIMTGAEPGKIHRLKPGDLISVNFSQSHSINLMGVLQLGYKLYPNVMPQKITLLTVEAEDITTIGTELTKKVHLAIPELIKKIREEFEEPPASL